MTKARQNEKRQQGIAVSALAARPMGDCISPGKGQDSLHGETLGKTFMSSAIILAAAAAGNKCAWIAPTYKQSRPLWRAVERAVAPVKAIVTNKSERMVTFPGGGFVAVYSADAPDSIRGEAFNLVVLDEASRIPEEAWTDSIQPTLADYNGDAILISTPKGRNWFYREFVMARADMRESAAFTAPSSDNPNPNIKRAAALAREHMPERTYRQEWLAEFVEDGGGVFRGVRKCATSTALMQAQSGAQYVFGVDWARSNDSTVISAFDSATRRQVALDRFTGIGYELQLTRLKALYDRFNPISIIAEANSMGGPLVERIQSMGLPVQAFTTNNASKAQVIEALALAFERNEIEILPDETQIAEFEAYEQERLPSGLIRYGAPDGMHDDTVIANALAWHGVSGGGNGWANMARQKLREKQNVTTAQVK